MPQTPRLDDVGTAHPYPWHPAKGHTKRSSAGSKTKKAGKAKKGSKGSGKPKALRVHGVAGAGSAGRTQGTGAGGQKPQADSAGQAAHTSSAHAGSPAAAWILAGSGTGGTHLAGYDSLDRLPGISGVLLDLVGEGQVGLSHALSAWQREQERVTNRTWRRPGGLARMGGL